MLWFQPVQGKYISGGAYIDEAQARDAAILLHNRETPGTPVRIHKLLG